MLPPYNTVYLCSLKQMWSLHQCNANNQRFPCFLCSKLNWFYSISNRRTRYLCWNPIFVLKSYAYVSDWITNITKGVTAILISSMLNFITRWPNLATRQEFRDVQNHRDDQVVEQACGRIDVTTEFLNYASQYERVEIYIC